MDLKAMGKRIKAARERAGLTQEALAEAVELSPMHISVIERGVKPPKLETFIKLANYLHVSADDLLQDSVDCSIRSRSSKISRMIAALPEWDQRRLLCSLQAFIDASQTHK